MEHLGSPPAEEIFRSGYLSVVIGLRLGDGREVVVKVRPDSPRVAACVGLVMACSGAIAYAAESAAGSPLLTTWPQLWTWYQCRVPPVGRIFNLPVLSE
jgi:hypothetical protein